MTRRVIIVGGGTAGWITACYLATRLHVGAPGAPVVTLIESPDIPIIGVGEGSFPSLRKTLKTIGIDEADLLRACDATFKQGIRFAHWLDVPPDGATGAEGAHYFHPFQTAERADGLDLLPYWLLGDAGAVSWAAASTVQKAAADAQRAPKLIEHPDYAGPLSYAYHFDAVLLGRLLRDRARALGVRHMVDTVTGVVLDADGAIAHLQCRDAGDVSADFYIDCTGMRAQLIGEALGVPFRSRRAELFVDRAVAIQVPYGGPATPLAAQTFAVAQPAGWIWDIGLRTRRGTGYVYSSAHTDDATALATLRRYIGPGADLLEHRMLRFEAGYRETQWRRNCVAIGLSAGFVEPLEATGIGFAEAAAMMLVNLFPWAAEADAARAEREVNARQFNAIMTRRYDHVVDFIKMHYALSRRDDTGFWRDNRDTGSWSPALSDRLDRWRYRVPDFLDVDLNHDIFLAANWQYVLYGMGHRTDLSARAGTMRYRAEARQAFAEMRAQQANAIQRLPTQRDLLARVSNPRIRFGRA